MTKLFCYLFDTILEEGTKKNMTSDEIKYSLGGKKNNHASVTLFNNEIYIHLRQFLKTKRGKLYPTKSGIALSLEEFRSFEGVLGQINKDIDNCMNRIIDKAHRKRTSRVVLNKKNDNLPPLKRRKDENRVNEGNAVEVSVNEIALDQDEKEILRIVKETIAETMYPLIVEMIKERCSECQVDHSNQVQHDICTMTEEQIDMFFVPAFEAAVKGEFLKWMGKASQKISHKVPNGPSKIRIDVWEAILTSDDFQKDIKDILLKI